MRAVLCIEVRPKAQFVTFEPAILKLGTAQVAVKDKNGFWRPVSVQRFYRDRSTSQAWQQSTAGLHALLRGNSVAVFSADNLL